MSLRLAAGSVLLTTGLVAAGVSALNPSSGAGAPAPETTPLLQSLRDAPVGTEIPESTFRQAEAEAGIPTPLSPTTIDDSTVRIETVAARTAPRGDRVTVGDRSMGLVSVPVRGGAVQVQGGVRNVSRDSTSAPIGSGRGVSRLFWHRDADAQHHRVRPSALWNLPNEKVGAIVTVRAHGQTYRYRIVSQQVVPKDRLPLAMYDSGGPGRIALVTCGGTLKHVSVHPDRWMYSGRSVTTAVLV